MGLLSFVREAGEKLFGRKDVEQAQAVSAQDKLAELNQKAAASITAYIAAQGFDTSGLSVAFDGASSTVSVAGVVADQATREKVLLCCGNVDGVEHVNDGLTVTNPEPEAQFHTVVRGDTLSAIAKTYYGNANSYMKIFEANKPMLGHPDKIYPGQKLRIPA
ncbi:peptidoglycan-binding protein LysM [Zoogloea sp.]|uniref:peptidoglycan-binding protein LysM n=1 Tax=Zoogloea sp. TaxID=49181 RepID=UPI0025EDAE42|nr:peptidoglycan-binding protein LysM [Zoogloea sp.]MCK6395575.1 peptidoglycan-binding protein LysM [Zoogloea sp.]